MKFSSVLVSASNYVKHPDLFDLRRKGVTASQYLRYAQKWMRQLNPQTIFDIGANTGQSAIALNALYPDADVYSFEPIPDCYASLVARTKSFSKIHPFNIGLGDSIGDLDFEVNEFPAASSFLPITNAQKETFDYASATQKISVEIDTLDNIAASLDLKTPILIKIDVQGFEDKVLLGGSATIRKSDVIIVETSFKHFYDNQPLFHEVYEIMRNFGFDYRGSLENMCDPKTGEILQSDSLFVRTNH
jgi:FkbM family methyltransferase